MFDEIINQIKNITETEVKNHEAAPAEHQEGITSEVFGTITEKIKSLASSGNFGSLQNLVSGNEDPKDNSTVQDIISSLTSKLSGNFAMDNAQASNLSSSLVPAIFAKVKEAFANGSIDIKSIMSQLNFSDILGMLKGGNKSGDKSEGGGSLFDKVKGLFS